MPEFDFSTLKQETKKVPEKKEMIIPSGPPPTLKPPKKAVIHKEPETPKNLTDIIKVEVQKEIINFLKGGYETSDDINIDKIANTSDLIRQRFQLITGKSWRGTNEGAIKELKNLKIIKVSEFSKVVAEKLKENPNYGNVINEFKSLVKKHNEKINNK